MNIPQRLPFKRSPKAYISILSTCIFISACDKFSETSKTPNMTALSNRLNLIYDDTRTVCFGRFIVDIPKSATVVYGPASAHYPLFRMVGGAAMLDKMVATRESDLKAEDRYPTGSGLNLYKETVNGVLPGQKIVIGFESFSSPFVKVESFFAIGPDVYIQEARSPDEPSEESHKTGTTIKQRVTDMNDVAPLVRPRIEGESPLEPGLCIDGAFVSEIDRPIYEHATLGIRLTEFPDVHISISTTKKDILVESDALEPRLKAAERDAAKYGGGAWYSRVKFFRRGDRQIAGWKGFEVLARKPPQDDSEESYEFAFLSQGEPNNPLLPVLDIKLDSGVANNVTAQTRSSLTDEEAVALWDKLTSSIRVRPTSAAAKTSEAAPARDAPLGELAATGRTCPQTGWWECVEESRPVQGDTRRLLKAGERMPHAVLLGEPSLWQKLKGEQPMYKAAATWKLVGYDEPQVVAAVPAILQDAPAASAPTEVARCEQNQTRPMP